MKKINPLTTAALFLLLFCFTSCEAIEGIFKAGMGFGMFIVIALIVLIIFVFAKLVKK
jgi:hypothetical protein